MTSRQYLNRQEVDLYDLVVDLKSQGYFADYLLPCPLCGSQPDVSNVHEIGIKLHDDARLCHDCLDDLIPGSANLLDLIASIQTSADAVSQSDVISKVLVALLNALSKHLTRSSNPTRGERDG